MLGFREAECSGRSAGQGDGKLELQSDCLGFMKDHSAALSVSSCLVVTFTIIFNTMWTFRHCFSMGLWGDFLVRREEHRCPLTILRRQRQAQAQAQVPGPSGLLGLLHMEADGSVRVSQPS